MSDLSELYQTIKEHKKGVREKEEPNRFGYARDQLKGFVLKETSNAIVVTLPQGTVTFYPYTGWFQGQKPHGNVKGRGIRNLMKHLRSITNEFNSKVNVAQQST
jgi:hypothetical protein